MEFDTTFEWDQNKRLSNIEKHGIDFVRVRTIFDGRPLLNVPSIYPDEARTLTVAILDDRHVAVVWTARNEKVRLISARPASKSERTMYQKLVRH